MQSALSWLFVRLVYCRIRLVFTFFWYVLSSNLWRKPASRSAVPLDVTAAARASRAFANETVGRRGSLGHAWIILVYLYVLVVNLDQIQRTDKGSNLTEAIVFVNYELLYL